jgi:hypothetical protein
MTDFITDFMRELIPECDTNADIEDFLNNISKYCSLLSYLTEHCGDLNERQLFLSLKSLRRLMEKCGQNTFDIIKKLSNVYKDIDYKLFVNNEYDGKKYPDFDMPQTYDEKISETGTPSDLK